MQQSAKKCFLCGEAKQSTINNRIDNKPIYEVICENCGKYKITDVLLKGKITPEQKQAAIWFIKDHPGVLISADEEGMGNIKYIEQEYRRYRQSNRC